MARPRHGRGDGFAWLQVLLTFLVSLVSAIGVLVVNSKVARLTGQVSALQAPAGHPRDGTRPALGLGDSGRLGGRRRAFLVVDSGRGCP